MKRFLKYLTLTTLLVLSLTLGCTLLFFIPGIQTWVAQKATRYLSDKLQTEVTLQHIHFQLPTELHIRDILVRDSRKDTLFYSHSLRIRFSILNLFKQKTRLSNITIDQSLFSYYSDSTGKINSFSFLLSKNTSTKQSAKTGTNTAWILLLDNIQLMQTEVRINDEQKKSKISINIPKASISCNGLNPLKKRLAIKEVTVQYPWIAWEKYGVSSAEDKKPFSRFLPENMMLELEKISITHGAFQFNQVKKKAQSASASGGLLDRQNIAVRDISIRIDSTRIMEQFLSASIHSMNAKEQSGLMIKQVNGKISISNTAAKLGPFFLETNYSFIRGNFGLNYNQLADLQDITAKTQFQLNIRQAQIQTADFVYLKEKWKSLPREKVKLSGSIRGSIQSITGKNLNIGVGQGTYLAGDCSIQGISNPQKATIDLSIVKAGTKLEDIQRWLPQWPIPKNLYTLGSLHFQGKLQGVWNDLQAKGTLRTQLGNLVSDIRLKFDEQKGKSAYQGFLSLQHFEIGKFFGIENQLGKFSMVVDVAGKGVTLESLDADIKGNISQAEIKGYNYQQVVVSGKVKNKSFNGRLIFDDPNIKGHFIGLANWQNEKPEYDFEADIAHTDLRSLNLMKSGNLNFSGKLNGHFSGKKLEDFEGIIQANNFSFVRNDSLLYQTGDITFQSDIAVDGVRHTTLRSDAIDADISGKFNFNTLIPSMKALALSIVYKDSLMPAQAYGNQFNFRVKTYQPEALCKIIDPRLKLTGNADIQGDVNTFSRELHIRGVIPQVTWKNFRIGAVELSGDYTPDGFISSVSLNNLFISDTLMVDTFAINAKRIDQEILVGISGANPKGNNQVNVLARIRPGKDYAFLFIDSSAILINNKLWNFAPENTIMVQGKKITTRNLIFRSDISSIYFNAFAKNDTSTSLQINLAQTNLSDFMGLLLPKKPDLHGMVNGKIVVENLFGKQEFTGDIVIEELKLGQEKIGDVSLSSYLDREKNALVLDGSVKSAENEIYAAGFFTLQEKKTRWIADIDIKRLGLNFLNYPFFNRYVKDVEGWATGKLHLGNETGKPGLTGKLLLQKALCTVTYTNVRYLLNNEEINLSDGVFDLGTIIGKDMKGNILVGSGKIYHDQLKYYTLDLKVSTDNGQFLNTSEKDNPTFYGQVMGSGYVTFTGSTKTVIIRGYAKTLPGTHCYLPIRDVFETNRYSFFRFETPQVDTTKSKKQEIVRIAGVTFTLDLDVTADATMEIILDPVAGDKLIGNGRGNLKIDIQRSGDINLYGQYEIEKGNYLFTLQNVISKPFQLERGGSINFSGSIYKAQLNANASYNLRTSTSDLIADLITDQVTGQITNKQIESLSKNIIPVKLLLALKGPLEKPGITFDIQPVNVDPMLKIYLDTKMQLVRNTETELNKQVFGLLIMNRFLPASLSPTGALGNSRLLGGSVASTLSEFLSNQFSLYANNLLANFVEGMNINIGYRQYNETSNGTNSTSGNATNGNSFDSRNAVQVALSKYFLKNRLSISAGGNVDFGSASSADSLGGTARNQNAVFAGDFQIEYSITPNGSWRAKAYNRTDFNNYNNRNNNRTGLGITYRKEFDNWWDFIGKKKKTGKKSEKINTTIQQSVDKLQKN